MVNTFLNSVTKHLGTTFGNAYHYYVEDVKQGLVKPCFTVDLLVPMMRSKSLVLYDRTMPLVLHYFSDDRKDLKKHLYEMAEQIVECVEYLPFLNTQLRGENISWQIVDDVLQIFVTYKFTTRKVLDEGELMETLSESVVYI